MAAFVDPFGDQTVELDELERRAEMRNPARHNHAHYFSGSVEEAIAESRARQGFLVVFLKGGDQESYIADETVHVSLGSEPVNCIALKLHDDVSNPYPQSFAKGKAFREIFPNIKQLPFLMVLSPDGKPLASLQGADVAKYAMQIIQKTALQYPFKDEDSNSAASAATQHPSPRPRTPVSPLVETPRSEASEPSNAATQIHAALNAAAGAPSMFPHTDVQNLAHALMAASQQAAHAAALTATPAGRQDEGKAPLPEAPVITSPPLPAIQHSTHASGNLGETRGGVFAQQGRASPGAEIIDSAQSAPHPGSRQPARAPSEVLPHRDTDLAAEREVMSQHMPVKTTTAPSEAAKDFAFAPHKSAAEAEKPATWKRGSQLETLPSSLGHSEAQRAKAAAAVGEAPLAPWEKVAAITNASTPNERQNPAPGAVAAATAGAALPSHSREGVSTTSTNTGRVPAVPDNAAAASNVSGKEVSVGSAAPHSGKPSNTAEGSSGATKLDASAEGKVPLASGGKAAPKPPAINAKAAHSTPSGTEGGTAATSESLLSGINKSCAKTGVASAERNEPQLPRGDLDAQSAQKLPVHSINAAGSARSVAGPHSAQHKSLGHRAPVEGSSPPVAVTAAEDGSSRAAEELLPSRGRTSLAVRLTDGSFIRNEFLDDDRLSTVFDYIDANRTDGRAAYVLRTPFPYRFLERSHGDETLRGLDLCPRSLLALQPRRGVAATSVSAAGTASTFDKLLTLLKKWLAMLILAAVGFFAGLFRVHDEQNGHTVQQRPSAHTQPQRTPLMDADTATPFQLQGGTVYEGSKADGTTVRQRRKEGNTYANGNSTEFKGDD